ncbi:MAG: acyl-CoA synthetase [Anaerolineales bacterium]|nr:MAG: acyl-CoA synthetase [Anaerolineales bacterium]
MENSSLSLAPYFSPHGIAVVGASTDPNKLGYGLARNLVQCNFQGVIHFVNPKGGSLFGRPIYPSVIDLPNPVDLAIILIPAEGVAKVLKECAERGIHAVIVSSGGFRETGEHGATLEKEILGIAREHDIRLIGPNCIGILDTHLPLDATFLPPPGPPPGDVAFISHSGAICAAVIDWARGQGFGLSRLVSLGNQADVTETDVLASVAEDRFTRVLTLYLEGVSNGRKFVQEARNITLTKPIVALKVGRYPSGQRAAASHTGALAGQENAFNAAFRRAGVIRADTSEELFDWARALAWSPLPKGRAIAVLTSAGGPGVTAADALEMNGMSLAVLAPETQAKLGQILPPAASLHNPVDMLASATPEQFAACLQVLLDDSGVHGVMVVTPPPPMHTTGAVAKTMIPIIQNSSKPVTIALMGERLIQEAVEHFRAARVPEYRFPERAASALAVLAQQAEYVDSEKQAKYVHARADLDAVKQVLQLRKDNPGYLDASEISTILKSYRLPGVPMRLAVNPEAAVLDAEEISYPVVLKIAAANITHKSDIGGVMLNLSDAEAVRSGFTKIVDNAKSLNPKVDIQGVYVQRMLPAGQEVILGAVQDAQFGPLVMFGSGGIEVEGLKDVAFSLAPLTLRDAEWMLESTWAGRRLHGFRSLPPADRKSVLDALILLGQLAADFPELAEIEINPLRVFSDSQGSAALDVRMRVA